MALLELQNLRVHFDGPDGTVTAVDDLSLALDPGETLGLVGESGCGKTVTARAAMGLLPRVGRTEGDIRFDGQTLTSAGSEVWRGIRGAQIAMVFQEPMTALNPVLSVGYQVAEAILAHQKIGKKAALSMASEMLDKVGIPSPTERLKDYPHQLSGGMRQRVMIAMALALKPRVLIADEPTTALDVTVQAQILELIKRLQAEEQMAVLLITHDLGVVAQVCDRVQVMYAGRVVEEGRIPALFDSPQHPYTQGLLRSIPTGTGRAPLPAIPGAVPSLTAMPSGCRFHPRCGRVAERCRTEAPPLEKGVACFFPGEEP